MKKIGNSVEEQADENCTSTSEHRTVHCRRLDCPRKHSRLQSVLRKLGDYVGDAAYSIAAVASWAQVVNAPAWYGMAILTSLVVSCYYGFAVALAFLIVAFTPISVVLYRKMRHEDKVQVMKFADRLELVSEEQWNSDIEYLAELKKKQDKN